jgi:hypothetical protein
MRLVAPADARTAVRVGGGRLYVWPKEARCCGGRQWRLGASTVPRDGTFRRVHAEQGLEVWAAAGLGEPEELHLDLGRDGAVRAYWNGLGWIA